LTRSTQCSEADFDVHAAWNDLLKAWTLPVIHALGLGDTARFNELKKRLRVISATSLAERLKELEQRGIVERRVYPETPPRVEYSLTKKGRELHVLLLQLADWVIRWNKKPAVITESIKRQKTPLLQSN
jgi:DNA-binding HxlR family transcriptional regulator